MRIFCWSKALIKLMILDQARLLSVPKVFCWCLILLLSWLAITENLKNWPDLASLAALVFSLTLCTLFFSPVLHLSFTKFKCLELEVLYEHQDHMKLHPEVQIYHPYSDLIPILLRVHPELLMRLSVSHHSAEHERSSDRRHEARQHPWPGSLIVIDIWLRINPDPSSLIWQLRIFLHQSCLASNSSMDQRWNWGIFTKQNWEAGWNSSSRSAGRIHVF